jgi:RNA polymerase sigma-70 factor (sigma-E family)
MAAPAGAARTATAPDALTEPGPPDPFGPLDTLDTLDLPDADPGSTAGTDSAAARDPYRFDDFEAYVRARQEALLRSARRLVPDPVDAQDLVQTALVRTFPRWADIADKGLADAYLRRVMINTRTEWWRSRRLDEVPTGELPDSPVDDGAERRADLAMILDAMAVLQPRQRQVVLLRHWAQYSTEETADALRMSIGTVKSTLHRALARLRAELEKNRLVNGYGYPRGGEETEIGWAAA